MGYRTRRSDGAYRISTSQTQACTSTGTGPRGINQSRIAAQVSRDKKDDICSFMNVRVTRWESHTVGCKYPEQGVLSSAGSPRVSDRRSEDCTQSQWRIWGPGKRPPPPPSDSVAFFQSKPSDANFVAEVQRKKGRLRRVGIRSGKALLGLQRIHSRHDRTHTKPESGSLKI